MPRFQNISANTSPFTLSGGKYGVNAHATWGGGSVGLQMLAADDTTWIPVHTALTADGYVSVDVPAGQYRFGVTTATTVYADVSHINLTRTG